MALLVTVGLTRRAQKASRYFRAIYFFLKTSSLLSKFLNMVRNNGWDVQLYPMNKRRECIVNENALPYRHTIVFIGLLNSISAPR